MFVRTVNEYNLEGRSRSNAENMAMKKAVSQKG